MCFLGCVCTLACGSLQRGECANAEAQFGSSGPAHAEGELEKEESYRTKLQLFLLRTLTVASPLSSRNGGRREGSGGLGVGFGSHSFSHPPCCGVSGATSVSSLQIGEGTQGLHLHILLIMTKLRVIS